MEVREFEATNNKNMFVYFRKKNTSVIIIGSLLTQKTSPGVSDKARSASKNEPVHC